MKLGGEKSRRKAGLYRIAKQFNLYFQANVPIRIRSKKGLDKGFFLGL